MRLDVSKALVAEGEAIPFSLEIRLPDTALMNERVAFPAAARLSGSYASVGDSIRLWGNLAFTARSRCVLCLQSAEKAFIAPFDALYALTPDPANPDLYLYAGSWIDPMEMAEEAAFLALPMRWRCAEDCRGLCPVCGADRNKTSCSCRMEMPSKHPFSALQQLLTEDESEV
ncbi:MAG: DUF177 domain-containing protein [Firmicutes bacterium]|nr:DUF177 domain-containing protein [Bacillota bacterium]